MQKIKLNRKEIEDILKDAYNALRTQLINSSTITATYKVPQVDPKTIEKPTILLSANAYLKMTRLVETQAQEIAWHATVTRDGNTFKINDVLIYPQVVSAATVNTDETETAKWYMQLSTETANSIRLQGHSHVNFGVSPSNTDTEYYQKLLQNIPDDEFYIFTIWNKKSDQYWLLYDFKSNMMYDTKDITVKIEGCDEISKWVHQEVKKNIKQQRPSYSYQTMFFDNDDGPEDDLDAFINARAEQILKNPKLKSKTKKSKK